MQRVFAALRGGEAAEPGGSTSRTSSSCWCAHYESSLAGAANGSAQAAARSPSTSTRTSICSSRALLDLWLGERDELCVVGDDYQAIYSFTGATPSLSAVDAPSGFRARSDHSARGELPLDTRDPRARQPARAGSRRLAKKLRRPATAGPDRRAVGHSRPRPRRSAGSSGGSPRFGRAGVADEEIAVLYRVNSRSDDVEGPLAARRNPVPGPRRSVSRAAGRPRARARLLRRLGVRPAASRRSAARP